MENTDHSNKAKSVWDAEILAYKNQNNIRHSSFELDRESFSKMATNALFSLATNHINSVKKKRGEQPYPPGVSLPDDVALWIQTKISNADDRTGNIGTHTYTKISDELHGFLQDLKSTF